MTTGFPAYQQQVPAGVWARLGGSIIDYLLLTLLYVAVVGLFCKPTLFELHLPSPLRLRPRPDFHLIRPLLRAPSYLHHPLRDACSWESLERRSGKRAMGTYVLVFDGSRVGYRRALLRELAKFPPLLVISAFMIVFRRDRLGLHDLISDTAVIMR